MSLAEQLKFVTLADIDRQDDPRVLLTTATNLRQGIIDLEGSGGEKYMAACQVLAAVEGKLADIGRLGDPSDAAMAEASIRSIERGPGFDDLAAGEKADRQAEIEQKQDEIDALLERDE